MPQRITMPQRSTDDLVGPQAPEALFISALLSTGEFIPIAHRIDEQHFSCWQKLYAFCVEYQQRAGTAPPLALVQSKFPEYEHKENLSPSWAAGELHKAHASRTLRTKLMEATQALKDQDITGAYAVIDTIERPRLAQRKPADAFDASVHEERFSVSAIPVRGTTLMRATGGIQPGDLWYKAGRPGHGKTWDLTDHAAFAAMHGYRVRYLSLEMRAARISMRSLWWLANKKELAALRSDDRENVKKAVDSIRDRTSGSIEVIDPSHGRITVTSVREHMDDCDLLLVDHAGLLTTADGRRAIDDWRAMATISNMMKEYALETGVAIVGGAQLNRTADGGHPMRPAKLSQLSQSDALGQDADVVITMKRPSKHCMAQSAEKVREGEGVRWFNRFDIAKMDFRELSKEQAQELVASDEDFDETS